MADVKLSENSVYCESDTMKAGNSIGIFEVDGIKFGLGICYDTFFSELGTVYRKQGIVNNVMY